MEIPPWLTQAVVTVLLSVGTSTLVTWWLRRRERREDRKHADIAEYTALLKPVREAAVSLAKWYEFPHLAGDPGYRVLAHDFHDAVERADAEIIARFGDDDGRSNRISAAALEYSKCVDEAGHDIAEAQRLAEELLKTVIQAPW